MPEIDKGIEKNNGIEKKVINIHKKEDIIDCLTDHILDSEANLSMNPDIQKLGITIFGSKDNFFSWYFTSCNRGPELGIPDGVSKIDALQKIQNFDQDIIALGLDVFNNEDPKFYRWFLKKNYYWDAVPLFMDQDKIKQAIGQIDSGNFG